MSCGHGYIGYCEACEINDLRAQLAVAEAKAARYDVLLTWCSQQAIYGMRICENLCDVDPQEVACPAMPCEACIDAACAKRAEETP
jgi:hypothetical protein